MDDRFLHSGSHLGEHGSLNTDILEAVNQASYKPVSWSYLRELHELTEVTDLTLRNSSS